MKVKMIKSILGYNHIVIIVIIHGVVKVGHIYKKHFEYVDLGFWYSLALVVCLPWVTWINSIAV